MHVAVTGASSGIGEHIAREFAGAGASVTLVARRRDALATIAAQLGSKTHVAAHDLGDLEHATDWIASAEASLGPIDVLVNNAGAHLSGPTSEVTPADGERLVSLDLLVPLRLTRHVLRGMLSRNAGTIVDVSALAALIPLPGMAHYNAAKAGLAAASESLRTELRATKVHVVTVYPGYIDTEMAHAGEKAYDSSVALRFMPRGTARELAARVRRAVERREARVLYPYPSAIALWLNAPMRWLAARTAPSLRSG